MLACREAVFACLATRRRIVRPPQSNLLRGRREQTARPSKAPSPVARYTFAAVGCRSIRRPRLRWLHCQTKGDPSPWLFSGSVTDTLGTFPRRLDPQQFIRIRRGHSLHRTRSQPDLHGSRGAIQILESPVSRRITDVEKLHLDGLRFMQDSKPVPGQLRIARFRPRLVHHRAYLISHKPA